MQKNDTDGSTHSILRIAKVNETDLRKFFLTANNERGPNEWTIELTDSGENLPS